MYIPSSPPLSVADVIDATDMQRVFPYSILPGCGKIERFTCEVYDELERKEKQLKPFPTHLKGSLIEDFWEMTHFNIQELYLRQMRSAMDDVDAQTPKRRAILDDLQAPREVIIRVEELCYLPQFLLPRVERHASLLAFPEPDRPPKPYLPTLCKLILSRPELSDPLKAQMQRETDAHTAILRAWQHRREQIVAFKKAMGIDKKPDVAMQKQRLWSPLFKELVDLLSPYCRPNRLPTGRVHSQQPTPEKAFKVAADLMNLVNPHLWPENRSALVKSRYYNP